MSGGGGGGSGGGGGGVDDALWTTALETPAVPVQLVDTEFEHADKDQDGMLSLAEM